MYKEKIVDAITGEETWRDYTDAEIAEVKKVRAEIELRIAEEARKENARKAIFEKLGITEEEANLLFS